MGKLLMVLKQLNALPEWKPPKGIDDAADIISQLGRNMHENAYLVGKTLLWTQRQLGNRKFDPWLKNKVKLFARRTAYRMMEFAQICDEQNQLLDYQPGKAIRAIVTQIKDKSDDMKLPQGDQVGKSLASKIAKALDKLTPKQKLKAIFWIDAILDQYREEQK